MKTTKKKTTKKTNTKKTNTKKESSPAEGLSELFLNELKDIFWAEKELVKAIPKMVKNAESEELANALNQHLEQTKEHVTRLEEVFSLLGEKAVAKKCEAMSGLVKEAEEIMKETEKGPVRDAAIILAGQKVEHYEIATYGTLCTFANLLEQGEIASILEETLHEEKDADEKLSEIATSSINVEAVEEEDLVSEEGEE